MQPKFIWWATSALNYHPVNSKENRRNLIGKIQTSSIPMRIITSNITIKKNKEDIKVIKHTQVQKEIQVRKDVPNVETHDTLRDSDVLQASINVKFATSMAILVACATRREKSFHIVKGLWSQDHPKHTNFSLAKYTCKILYAANQKIYPQLKIYFACNYNWSPHNVRPSIQHHNIKSPI